MRRLALLLWSLSMVAVPLGASGRADHLTDLREWHKSGLPATAAWNCQGFPPSWHVEQVRQGHRLIPSVFFPNYDAFNNNCLNPRQIDLYVNRYTADLQWLAANNVPLCIRTNNICDGLSKSKRYRGGDPATQPLVYRRLVDSGAPGFDQRPICDPFAGATHWETEGRLWGGSPWVRRIADFVPNPPWVMFVENNEGSYDGIGYNDGKGCLTKDGKWRPDLDAYSVRTARWQTASGGTTDAARTIFAVARKDQYGALYREFRAAGPSGWQTVPWYTAGYGGSMSLAGPRVPPDLDTVGYDPEGLPYDALSGGQYIKATNGDLTSINSWSQPSNLIPHWEWTEKRNTNAYREISVSINAAGAVTGANAGRHEVVLPAVWDAWLQGLMWGLREPGRPLLLRHWIGSATKPTDPFDNRATPDPRLAGLTHADYIGAMVRAVDRICEHPTLREFWLKGKPVVNRPETTDLRLEATGLRKNGTPQASSLKPQASTPAHPSDVFVTRFGGTPFVSGENDNRWRVLDCDQNTPRSEWKWGEKGADGKDRNIVAGHNKVWATATEIREKGPGTGDQAGIGDRGPGKGARWLVYAFSPCALSEPIRLTIPGAGDVTVEPPQPWAYYVVEPAGIQATKLEIP